MEYPHRSGRMLLHLQKYMSNYYICAKNFKHQNVITKNIGKK